MTTVCVLHVPLLPRGTPPSSPAILLRDGWRAWLLRVFLFALASRKLHDPIEVFASAAAAAAALIEVVRDEPDWVCDLYVTVVAELAPYPCRLDFDQLTPDHAGE